MKYFFHKFITKKFLEKLGLYFKQNYSFLTSLNCSECEFMGPECSRFLACFEQVSLTELIFDGNLICDTDQKLFADSIEKVRCLKTLSLNKCRIGSNGAAAIAERLLIIGPQLTKLYLQQNRITVFFSYNFLRMKALKRWHWQ